MEQVFTFEDLGGGVFVCTSKQHTFGTDSFLLASFAQAKRNDYACDLGTGCGIIPLLLLRSNSAPRHCFGVDIQPQAILQLEKSIDKSALGNKITPILGDIRDLKKEIQGGSISLITCNPPYKAAGTGVLSSSLADQVARHETQCTLTQLCKTASVLLKFSGRLCICQLPERLPDIITAMRENNIEPKRMRFVHKNAHCAPWLVLVEGRLGGKPFLQVEKPLLMQ